MVPAFQPIRLTVFHFTVRVIKMCFFFPVIFPYSKFCRSRGMQLIRSQIVADREILKAFRVDVKEEILSLPSPLSPSICIKCLTVALNRNDILKKTKCCLTF